MGEEMSNGLEQEQFRNRNAMMARKLDEQMQGKIVETFNGKDGSITIYRLSSEEIFQNGEEATCASDEIKTWSPPVFKIEISSETLHQ